MLQCISQKLAHVWQQVKATFLSPPSFTSLSEIMAYQAAIFTHQVLRLRLSQADYTKGRLSLGPSKQALGYAWTASKWTATLSGYLTYYSYLSTYSRLLGGTLGLPDFGLFALATSISLTLGETFWWTQVDALLLGSPPKNDALTLLYTYANPENLSLTQLSHVDAFKLVVSFNRQNTHFSRYSGFLIFINFLHLPSLLWRAVTAPNCTLLQKLGNCLLLLNINLQGVYLFLIILVFAGQALLVLRLFKTQLTKALLSLSRVGSSLNSLTLKRFTSAYLSLHRQMRQYDTFLCQFSFMVDMQLKLSGTLAVVFLLKTGALLSNAFGFASFAFILSAHTAVNGAFTLLAVFPQANLNAYRSLSRLYVQMHLGAKFGERGSKQRPTWAQKIRTQRPVNVRQALSANGFLQFLASRQFGFTYGRQFLIEKRSVLENVLATVFYFLLYIKRRI